MADKLFTEFPPVSTAQWEEVINKDLKGADYEKKLVWKTEEGFSLRPYYRAEDLRDLRFLGSEPGGFPYIRGTKCNNDWKVRQDYCAWESYSDANAKAVDGLSKGVEAVGFCIDGRKEISVADMKVLLKGIFLNMVEVSFTGCCTATPAIIKSFLAVAKENGIKNEDVKASFDYSPYTTLTQRGYIPEDKTKEIFEFTKDYPGIKIFGIEGYDFNDAGSNITQELAFALAQGSEYLSGVGNMGIDMKEAAKKMKFTFSIGSSYFMEIAKFRAARMLWANIVKAYGIECTDARKMDIHAVTSEWNQTVYDPYVNMLRGTTEAMSAALAGVDSIEVLPFDYKFRAGNEFGNRIARNTQIILKEESHFDKVVDPAAGSYYIENLTDSIAKAAWDLFKAVEAKGGYTEAFKTGFVQETIKATADKRDKDIATRRLTVLGTNQYPNFTEKAGKEITKDVVTRKGITTDDSGKRIAQPLEKYRGAQAFEALRLATDVNGKQPVAFMLTFGNLAMCRARAQFASNFFAVAGFKVVDNNRFSTIEEGVKAALEAKAEIVVACSSDDGYTEAVPQIANLIGNKAIVVVAGDPASKDELTAKGITHFINVKSNVLETLKEYQKELGIKSL